MRFVRTMMALVIALSVAMLPAAGSAASIVKWTPQAATETMAKGDAMARNIGMTSDMSGAMDECCPDQANDHSNDQRPLACCAVQAMNLAIAIAFRFDPPMIAGNPLPIPVDQVVARHDSNPPFRPPRV